MEGYFERSFKKVISLNNCWSWKADKFNSIKKAVSLFVIRKGFISPNVPKIILFDLIKHDRVGWNTEFFIFIDSKDIFLYPKKVNNVSRILKWLIWN